MRIIRQAVPRARRGAGITVSYGVFDFPGGLEMMVGLCPDGLCWLGFSGDVERAKTYLPGAEWGEDAESVKGVAAEILKLWPGDLTGLSVPLVLYGTDFQLKVWDSLLEIPCGETVTYGAIADELGKPDAMRAVGGAVGSNPVSLVVPCHRVVNADGYRRNYGWGGDAKEFLLDREAESALETAKAA